MLVVHASFRVLANTMNIFWSVSISRCPCMTGTSSGCCAESFKVSRITIFDSVFLTDQVLDGFRYCFLYLCFSCYSWNGSWDISLFYWIFPSLLSYTQQRPLGAPYRLRITWLYYGLVYSFELWGISFYFGLKLMTRILVLFLIVLFFSCLVLGNVYVLSSHGKCMLSVFVCRLYTADTLIP